MPDTAGFALSVKDMFAERDAKRRREQEAASQLERQAQEQLTEFRKRLDSFQMTDAVRQLAFDRIRRAFERGDHEMMIIQFPSSFCTDSGRAIINADAPPIVKPDPNAPKDGNEAPGWLATLPKGAVPLYEFWKAELKPGGFQFSARIVNYPDGMPGDVGLFFSWPKSAMEMGS